MILRVYKNLKNIAINQLYKRLKPKNHINKSRIHVYGYINSVVGVGEVSRNFIKKLTECNIDMSIHPINASCHSVINYKDYFNPKSELTNSKNINFLFINSNEFDSFCKKQRRQLEGSYNIAIWWWELDDHFPLPENLEHLNEVLVFSDFIKNSIQKVLPETVIIRKIDYPFIKTRDLFSKEHIRKKYKLPDDNFTFINCFDFYSSIERKNPCAIIEAFAKSFQTEDKTSLVFKINNAKSFANDYKLLKDLIDRYNLSDKVTIINERLSKSELMSLISACDCYISLHRSEGLGLPLLEAMSMGIPSIATKYSGNLEFMNEENSLLISARTTTINKSFGPYKEGWKWSDPDLNDCIRKMQRLYRDQSIYKSLQKSSIESIKKQYANNAFKEDFEAIVSEASKSLNSELNEFLKT